MNLQILSAEFAPAIEAVYKYEGGFQKMPQDTGNYYKGKLIGTNLGITPVAYQTFYKVEPTERLIQTLTKAKASPIYRANYWNKIRGDEIKNDSVAELMFDIVVNSGTGMLKSFKQLMNQTAGHNIVNVSAAPFTSNEVALLNALPADVYFRNIKTWRENFYKALVKTKPANEKFLKGWLNRLNKHTYSGATTFNYKKPLIIGLASLAIVSAGVVAYKHYHKKAA